MYSIHQSIKRIWGIRQCNIGYGLWSSHEGSLHALCYLPNICYSLWYFAIHIRNLLFICGILLFIFTFATRYSYLLFICVIRIAHICAVTNKESNAITCSVHNRKIHSKRLILLCYLCCDYHVIVSTINSPGRCNQLYYSRLELFCNIMYITIIPSLRLLLKASVIYLLERKNITRISFDNRSQFFKNKHETT